jgi:hypothetical protein
MAGNSVPIFFGAKAQTRRPAAVDVTITYDHSVSNGGYIAAFRDINNIKEMEAELAVESIGVGADENRYSITSFEFLMHTLLDNEARVWIDASELDEPGLEWQDSRNIAFNGTSDEDETGAIYNIMTGNRSLPTLVEDPATNWPRTNDSWTSETELTGPVIDGSYRIGSGRNIRGIIISESTEEASADIAIPGTYGIGNGAPGVDYNLDNRGPSSAAGNNTKLNELSDAIDDPAFNQILVFIDDRADGIGCTLKHEHITAGLIPDEFYAPAGVVFPSQTLCTIIYAPGGNITSKETTYFVGGVPVETLTGMGQDIPGSTKATKTYYYAKRSNGAVLGLRGSASTYMTHPSRMKTPAHDRLPSAR